jgi:hypothetical protein
MAKKTKSSGAALETKKQLWAAWTRDVIAHFPYSGSSNDAEIAIEFATDVADGMLEAYEELERMLKTGEPRRGRAGEEEEEEDSEEEDDDDNEEDEDDE